MATADSSTWVVTEVRGAVGFVTLNRPQALNALDLGMVRALTETLQDWQRDPAVALVAIRGSNKTGPFGSFCAGGDIRFFHRAALAGDPALDDFFTEEYALNHLIHRYSKPYVAFMNGVVMGGGMGISQGAQLRLVTSNTRMAMPETQIGLFPDVGGGYFLSRCPGHWGEWLALTGEVIGADLAVALGLADTCMDPAALQPAWDALGELDLATGATLESWQRQFTKSPATSPDLDEPMVACFGGVSVPAILQSLAEQCSPKSLLALESLRRKSPLMLHVALQQIRRARELTLEDVLRMERDLVRHCFAPRHLGKADATSETLEGIRALAIDKDHQPRWSPPTVEEVTPAMVEPFFTSPWPAQAHPLASLG
jgi:enoyl-CoA hydratase